jgi:hypothetical protein
MLNSRIEQRLNVSRNPTGLEQQDKWDAANRAVDPKSLVFDRLCKYAIACRPLFQQWDNTDSVIVEARKKHDQGLAVLCQRTTKTHSILFLIPHVRRVGRKPYFSQKAKE